MKVRSYTGMVHTCSHHYAFGGHHGGGRTDCGLFIKDNWSMTDLKVTCKKCQQKGNDVCPYCGNDLVRVCSNDRCNYVEEEE